jgi:hypothetical protein
MRGNYKVRTRFYQVGSTAGQQETNALLRAGRRVNSWRAAGSLALTGLLN